MKVVELDVLRDSLVGVPGQSGLSVEARKRLSIAVEQASGRCCTGCPVKALGLCIRRTNTTCSGPERSVHAVPGRWPIHQLSSWTSPHQVGACRHALQPSHGC